MHELRHQLAGTTRPADSGDPDIRILRRVSTLDDFPLAPRGEGPFQRIALLDTETTGTNPDTDEVIDIAVVVLEVDAAGEIVGIASRWASSARSGHADPAAHHADHRHHR